MSNVRRESDNYPTPASAIMPLMQDMITNGEAKHWSHILDLGCGDGRLGRSAADAYKFSLADGNFLLPPYIAGVEENAERAVEATNLGVDYVHAETLAEYQDCPNSDERPTLIIANPPFSQAQEFLEYALSMREDAYKGPHGNTECPTVIFLLRLNFMGAQKRYEFWAGHERPRLRVLSQRPSFTPTPGTDMTDYAWYIWTDRDIPALDWYAPRG